MNYTTNYQLPQWVQEDRIMMEDFNDMTAKVDEALGEHETLLSGVGNCKIVAGSYVGTGTYYDTKNTLTFPGKPMMVVLFQQIRSGSGNNRMIMIRGATWSYSYDEYSNSRNGVTWGETSVSWSCNSATYQYNEEGQSYCYIALLAADA